jgi:hypothetical protein
VHNKLGCEAEEDVLEEANGKLEAGPIVSVLKHLETVAIEVGIAVKVHGVEGFHGDLAPPAVLNLIGIVLEGQVVLDGAAWELDLLVLAGDEGRRDIPEGDQDGDGGEEGKEDCGLQAAPDFPGQVEGDDEEDGEEEGVGKPVTARAVGGEGSILDGRGLCAVLAEVD